MKKYNLVCLFARQLGLETLKGIINDDFFNIKTVFTHYYERNMKNKRPLFEEYVKICELNGVPLIVVNKNQNTLTFLRYIDYDFLIANCYKYKISDEFLDFANIASINMHRSLLPKYKGLKPLRKALKNNEKKTGTTIHILTPEMDSGKIIYSN